MEKNIAIKVTHVSKDFKLYYDRANTLKEKLLFFSKKNKSKDTLLHVLQDINLSIEKGESVALIGTNGSGKSTLLKLMTKIIYPNKGKITTNGKLTSLLELGAGFHDDFTGRENIYFNASIFGLTKKEIDEKVDEIIEFSELQEFIDNPVFQVLKYALIIEQFLKYYNISLPVIPKVFFRQKLDLQYISEKEQEYCCHISELSRMFKDAENKYPKKHNDALRFVKAMYYNACHPIAYDDIEVWSKK